MIHIIVLLSLLFPIPLPIIAISIGVAYGLLRHFKTIITHITSHLYILSIFSIASMSCILTNNRDGLIVAGLLFGLWIYCITLSKDMTPFLFEGGTSVLLIASWFHAGYALLQHLKLVFGPDYHAWHHSMISWRDGRADSVFLNPNYYAFMCIVYLLLALYKIQIGQPKWRYYMTIVVNVFGVIFTQSRTALAVIFIVILTFYYCILPKQSRRWLRLSALAIAIGSPALQLLPRFDYGTIMAHLIDIRFDIWNVAIRAFLQRPLLGYGPFAYRMLHPIYGSYPTQHAHNLYIDSLLNYGIIGSVLLVVVLLWLIRKTAQKHLTDKPLYALGVSLIALILTHGLLDVSIVFIHTLSVVSFLFIYIIKTDVA